MKNIILIISIILSLSVNSSSQASVGEDGTGEYIQVCNYVGEDGTGFSVGEDGTGYYVGEDGTGYYVGEDGTGYSVGEDGTGFTINCQIIEIKT